MVPNPIVEVTFNTQEHANSWNRWHGTSYTRGDTVRVDSHELKTSRAYRYKQILVICDDCQTPFYRRIAKIKDGMQLCRSCVQSGNRSCHYGTHRTAEQKRMHSLRMRGENNPYFGCKHTKEEREKSRIANLGNTHHKDKHHTDATKQLISTKVAARYGDVNNVVDHKNQHSGTYRGKSYQGRFELAFLKHVETFGMLEETVRGSPVQYVGPDGNTHVYLPDFFIPSLNLVVEIKSDVYAVRNERLNSYKWSAARAASRFIVIAANDFTELDNIIRSNNQ